MLNLYCMTVPVLKDRENNPKCPASVLDVGWLSGMQVGGLSPSV